MPPSITESPSPQHNPPHHHHHLPKFTPPSSSSKRGKEKNRRNRNNYGYVSSSNSHGHAHGHLPIIRTIYCPRTDTTYEGEVRVYFHTPPSHQTTDTKYKNKSLSSSHSSASSLSTSSTSLASSTSSSSLSISSQPTIASTTSTSPMISPAFSPISFPTFIKHGKGTIHNHSDNTTLVGFFQDNEIIGHALQTFYNNTGVCAIAIYEGSFLSITSNHKTGITGTGTCTGSPTSERLKKKGACCKSMKKCCNCVTSLRNMTDNPINTNTKNKSKDGRISLSPTSPTSFTNEFLRHGFGKYSWPLTGDEYVGEFHHGNMQGKGTFTWGSTGERYEGYWYKGRMHGEDGKKLSKSGDEFIGTFVKGRATGWGVKNFTCGDVHHGMYRKDKRHGFGSYKWNNGDQYIGQWKYGCMVGRGIKCLVHTPERGSIISQINNNNGMQRGDLTEVFHGTLMNGKAQGYGVKHYACGDVYCGQYENDLRHGYGEYTWSNEGLVVEAYSGQWINGRMCGIGVKSMGNGDMYDGEFVDDEAHGFGVKTFGNNGDIHLGEYQHNLRHGKGLYRWSNGDEYEGDYVKGEQSGFGCYRWNNGSMTFDGRWLDGQKHGPGFLRVDSSGHETNNIGILTEQNFFEVWSKGKRLFRDLLNCSWVDLPDIEKLPQYQSWKHVWENGEGCESQNNRITIGSENVTVPMSENENSTLEPNTDDILQHSLQPEVNHVQRIRSPESGIQSRRHYSVDFYSSSLSEEVKPCERARSSSFSSYLSSTTVLDSRNRRGPRSSCVRKVHHDKGGFVVISGLRKKIRIYK